MTRLQLEENEKITIKEYQKRKKKQAKILRKKSKITYLSILVIILLLAYIVIQVLVYNNKNNYSYLSDENVDNQTVYNVYYITEGYTYSPKYSLSSIYSNGNNDEIIISDIGFSNINVTPNLIVGIKENKLYKFDKNTKELTLIIDKEIDKFTIYNNEIYVILTNKDLYKFNLENSEFTDLNIKSVSEILVDDNNIFVVKDEKVKKQLYKYDKNGGNGFNMNESLNVSYIIEDETTLYFVNKADNNRIYRINKDGSNCSKVADISSVTDNGIMKSVDGSKYMYTYNKNLYYVNSEDSYSLWKYNFDTGENKKEISMPVELLQNVNETVFYKVKNDIGVYLYNTDTNFMSQITKRKVKEFLVDIYTKVFIDENKNNNF